MAGVKVQWLLGGQIFCLPVFSSYIKKKKSRLLSDGSFVYLSQVDTSPKELTEKQYLGSWCVFSLYSCYMFTFSGKVFNLPFLPKRKFFRFLKHS